MLTRNIQQASLFEQDGGFQHVGDRLAHRDDVVGHRLRSEHLDGGVAQPLAEPRATASSAPILSASICLASRTSQRMPNSRASSPPESRVTRAIAAVGLSPAVTASASSSAITSSCTSEFCRMSSPDRWNPKTRTASRNRLSRSSASTALPLARSDASTTSRSASSSAGVTYGSNPRSSASAGCSSRMAAAVAVSRAWMTRSARR